MDLDEKLEQKVRELADKYEVPPDLLFQAIEMEQDKVVLKNRRLGPKLVELIGSYAENLQDEDGGH